jgi:drug/metabolite transporter (DMT)-like permease
MADIKTPLVEKEKKEEVKDLPFLKLVVFINLGILCFLTSDVIKKWIQVERGVPVFEFVFMRSLVTTLISYILACLNNDTEFLPPKFRSLLIWRTIITTSSLFAIMLIFSLLPLTLWTVIVNSRPIWTMLILWFYLSEKISMCDILAFAGSLVGVVFVSI